MDYNLLSKAAIFRGFNPDEVAAILSAVPFRVRKYKAGSVIAHSGETVNSFLMVLEGVAKGEMTDFSGRVIKIEDIPASAALAAAFLFGAKNVFPVNVVAASDLRLFIIDKPDFLRFLKSHEKILVNFLDIISNRSQFLSDKIKFLNFKTIKGKLAQYFLQSAGPARQEITLGLTQTSLAEYFGVARPSIARVMGELEDEGIIVTRGKNLKILDRQKLTDLTLE